MCACVYQTRHDIMVPIGPLAFMPGHLIHTNEITVLLGESYFAERSAEQASGIISRRKDFIQKLIKTSEAEEKKLSARAHTSDHMRRSLLEGFAEDQSEDAAQANQPPHADGDDEDDYEDYDDEDEDDGKVILPAQCSEPAPPPSSARRGGRATTSGPARASSGPGPTPRTTPPAPARPAPPRTRSSRSSRSWSRSAAGRAG